MHSEVLEGRGRAADDTGDDRSLFGIDDHLWPEVRADVLAVKSYSFWERRSGYAITTAPCERPEPVERNMARPWWFETIHGPEATDPITVTGGLPFQAGSFGGTSVHHDRPRIERI